MARSPSSTPARALLTALPLIHGAVSQWNTFLERLGLPAANIVMNRRYDDGTKHIGWHSDDVKDLHELGLIVVLRTGRRAFQVRDKETQRMVFDRALEPVNLLIMIGATAASSSWTFRSSVDLPIMTAHGSNLVTEHCVPKEAGATAASSSWTFRTSVRREVQEALRQKIEKAQRDAERRSPKSR